MSEDNLKNLKDCACGNPYITIRTDIYKDKREFVYCDVCGALGTLKLWQARDDGTLAAAERERCAQLCEACSRVGNNAKLKEQMPDVIRDVLGPECPLDRR